MKKWIFPAALFLCVSFSNSQNTHKCDEHNHGQFMVDLGHISHTQVLDDDDARYIQPYTVQTRSLSVKAMEIKGFDGDGLTKLERAFEMVEAVVNTEEFKNRVINFKNKEGQNFFKSNKKLKNEQIYALFMDGREVLQQNTPGEMNFFLNLYHKPFSKVIGWTNGKINTIHVNWKYFKTFKTSDVAGNLVHEWTHKLGFDHTSAKEHDSVPYAIGYIVREMGERYLKGEELY